MAESANSEKNKSKPKPYHHGDLRNALIQTGLEMLSEGGSAALDLRGVARRSGVSHAAPYRHFADKQALIAAISEEGFRQLADSMHSAVQGLAGPMEKLQAIARVYVQFAQEHPWLVREMFSGLSVEREAYPDLYTASKVPYKMYAEIIEQGQAAGSVIEGDARGLAGVYWSLIHGIAMLTIEKQMRPYSDGPDGAERVTRFSVQLLFEGLRRS